MYTSKAKLDRITTLPFASLLLSNHFSGFLKISPTKYIHYFYIESENDPKKDSVIFWSNGGPGCSGLIGLFTELGPWRPIENGTVVRNPYSWTTNASIVFLEQPVGVGFSYSSTVVNTNDFQSSIDNVATIKQFFLRFPERRNNAFYLASESYGGHYIPQLTLMLLNNVDKTNLYERFHGFLLGNPFTSFTSGFIGMWNAMWGHQAISGPTWTLFKENNCDDMDIYNAYNYPNNCYNLLNNLLDEALQLNPYSLSTPLCAELTTRHRMSAQMKARLKRIRPEQELPRGYDPCAEAHLRDYLNRPEVQRALHVLPADADAPIVWEMCSDAVWNAWPAADQDADTTHLFSEISLHPRRAKPFHMLIYSGDQDSVCSTIGTQQWVYSVAGAAPLELWRPWLVGGQTAGFLTRCNNSLTFATVHGAGHEVPAYQPQRALELLRGFLSGQLFIDSSVPLPPTAAADNHTPAVSHTAVILLSTAAVLVLVAFLPLLLPRRTRLQDRQQDALVKFQQLPVIDIEKSTV